MDTNNKEEPKVVKEEPIVSKKKPDELSGIHIESKIKIYDPESGKILVEGRA
jgi:hypothetical protein